MGVTRLFRKALNKGCASCGGGPPASVPLVDWNKNSPFNGDLLLCPSCARLFCESSVVLEDERTMKPLRTLLGDGSQPNPDLPRLLFVSADPSPPRTTHYKCVVGRRFQSELGVEFIRNVLWYPILLLNLGTGRALIESLSIDIDGYSEDEREIWQIPEVTSFFYRLHKEVPTIEFWLTADSLKVFLKTAAAGIPQARKTELLQMSAAMDATMKQMEMGAPLDNIPDELQLLRWLMIEAGAKIASMLTNVFKDQPKLMRRIEASSEFGKLYKAVGFPGVLDALPRQ